MSTQPPEPGEDDLSDLSEEELRAAYEAEIARVRVEDVLVQTVVSLLNLAARKAGLTGAEEEPDFEQVRQAIDATIGAAAARRADARARRSSRCATRSRSCSSPTRARAPRRRRTLRAPVSRAPPASQPARWQRALGARAVGAASVRPVSMRARLSPLGASRHLRRDGLGPQHQRFTEAVSLE